MIFTKLIYLFLSINSTKNTYYKLIYKKEIKGCVEGNVTEKFAKKFNALPGTCKDFNCTIFNNYDISGYDTLSPSLEEIKVIMDERAKEMPLMSDWLKVTNENFK